jgi:predicted transcriptional regulator
MRDKKIAKLPVVNDSGHLIGMISQFDIRNMVHNEDTRGKFDRVGEQTNRLDDPVKEYMSGLVYTVDHLPKFSEAAGLMLDKEIGSLVIVDKNNSPEGIVTKKDLLQTIAVSNI